MILYKNKGDEKLIMINPRPYQVEALKAVMKNWREGETHQLVSLPTGTGKTILFGMVAEAMRVRTLVLAHREELLYQAKQKIRLIYPDADIGILKAEEKCGLDTDICVASVQTAVHYTKVLEERGFKLCICDEAHHAVSPSYMKIFNELGFMDGDKNKLLLGVTATAYRGDKAGLGAAFNKIVFERSILAMMRAGYLCDLKGLEVRTGADISGVHTRTGDFALDELSEAVDTPERNAFIADTYIKHGEGRRGVVFCVKVKHAHHLAEAFKERGVPCEAVWGDMPSDDRREAIKRYENKEIKVLTNVGVLTEGWDSPDTDIIMMARPTKSSVLYMQCVGRGLRLAPNKKDCLLVDFVDNARRHKLCKFGTLTGGKYIPSSPAQTLLEAVHEAEREQKTLISGSDNSALTPVFKEIELFERSQFVWQLIKDKHYRMSMWDGSSLWCKLTDDGYLPLVMSTKGEIKQLSDEALPLNYAHGVCEDYVRKMRGAEIYRKDAPWRDKPASDKQISALRQMSINFNENLTRGEAAALLGQRINAEAATDKQLWFIKHYKLHENPDMLTKSEAGKLIAAYKERESHAVA